jgi:hypothetical protein
VLCIDQHCRGLQGMLALDMKDIGRSQDITFHEESEGQIESVWRRRASVIAK